MMFLFKPYQYVLDNMQCFAVKEAGELSNWAWKQFDENVDFSGCKKNIINSEKNKDKVVGMK